MKIDVLNKGYVRLVTWMPWNHEGDRHDDLTAVNAARASFKKESELLDERDVKLLQYLARNNELSPLRHAMLTFEVHAPMVVARQWFKYRVGSTHTADDQSVEITGWGQEQVGFDDVMQGWNESSRRYITESPEFYTPETWRGKPTDGAKQGSSSELDEDASATLDSALEMMQNVGLMWYNEALRLGATPEQARLFLPAYGMYLTWRWTVSGNGLVHFLRERLAHNAQSEIREYAEAVKELGKQAYPNIVRIFVEGDY